jgi:hypothetical protein
MKVLYLVPKNLWERRVSASRRHDIMALQRREDVTLHISGQGFGDWSADRTALENVHAIMPDADVIARYKLNGNKPMGIPPARDYKALSDEYLVAEKWQEMWPKNPAWGPTGLIADFVESERVGLAICSHANELHYLDGLKDKCRAVYIPHCAEPSVFAAAAKPWEERDIDILLTGAVGLPHYPLRTRLAKLMKDGKLPGKCYHLPHPGYWRNSIEECEAVVREYASWLGRSKIALCTCSKWRYRLAKIPEAAMAGCLVVGDLPEGREGDERNFVVDIGGLDDERIVEELERCLSLQDIMKDLAAYGRGLMMRTYTQAHWALQFCDAVREAIA